MSAGTTRRDRVTGWTRPAVRAMRPYYKAPLEGDPLRLDQNTNLDGPNPALARVDPASLDVTLYPSRDADLLLSALADWHGVGPEHFVVGNGSDECLDMVTKAFTVPGQCLATPWPSYSLYPFYAQLQDLHMERVPLRGHWRLDVDALVGTGAAVTLLATPNNPTGTRFPAGDLEEILERTDGVVVVDEAYIEYAGLKHSLLGRVDEYDNLLVMRTFSKAYGLAGLRAGYVAGNPELVERLLLVKPPFNLNLYTERVAAAALDEQDWLDRHVAGVVEGREAIHDGVKALGFEPYDSAANFVLARSPLPPAQVVDALRRRGILIRHFPGVPGLDEMVRFGVGRPEHTGRLLAALAEVMAEARA